MLQSACTAAASSVRSTHSGSHSTQEVNEIQTSLCGRDGRTICGPLCVPKSTYVTLAHKRKQKFFYFGYSLVRRFYCKKGNKNNKTTSANGTDGQTDRQTECDAICGPLLRRRAA